MIIKFPALIFSAAFLSLPIADAQLLLTEIHSSPSASGVDDYWEITNTGEGAINLSGYRWTDSAGTFAASSAWALPEGTSIAVGESIIFTKTASATAFRTWWGSKLSAGVQVFAVSTSPGLGSNDGAQLFDSAGTRVINFSYAANGFTRTDNSASAGGHAGVSAGGTASQAAVWASASGSASPRYTFADGVNLGTFVSATSASDMGSPGFSGFGVAPPSISLAVSATPQNFTESASNPAATGTVTRDPVSAEALVVQLFSSDATEAIVPTTVTILANEASANFGITAVDDTFPDGNKIVTLTATATDSSPGTYDLSVEDDGDTLDTDFLLTEIQSNQSASSPANSEDYWELTNIGDSTRDISGYSWHDSGRSGSTAASYKLPPRTTIAPGESVIFTEMPVADFRTWWNIPSSAQVFQSIGAPGLGKGDGISFFDPGQNELFFFTYAVGGFTMENGNPSVSEDPANPTDTTKPGHAGIAAGGNSNSQALIWVPSSGTATPRYTAATGSNHASFQASVGTDLGSPGNKGEVVPTVSIADASLTEGDSGTTILNLVVTRSDADTAFTVDYAVTGGTATNDVDFTFSPGTLTFTQGGVLTDTVSITISGDTVGEPNETVIVSLSNLVSTVGNTAILDGTGTGTIINDDPVQPSFSSQTGSTSIGSGGSTTLIVSASGFPTPTFQWFLGEAGNTSNPIGGATSSSFTTPALTETTRYWVRATSGALTSDSETIVVTIAADVTLVDLSTYVRVGRYSLPEPGNTALPSGTPAHNLLCQEASGVTYNWDTDTLFIVGDGSRSITQVSKTGVLIDTMTLALRTGAPQGTDFYDLEGITYIGNNEFVVSEERDRQLVKISYTAGVTKSRADAQTVKLGTFVDNIGTEGMSWDPLTNGFIVMKEKSPIGIFQTAIDFVAGTASNGSNVTQNSTNLFDPALLGMTDVADVYALSNLPTMSGKAQEGNLLVIGQEDARVVNVDRSGNIHSSLQIVADPGSLISAPDQQHEGITMDRAGFIYVVNENGGGNINFPELWVYAPSSAPNTVPTGITLNNPITSIVENTSTASRIKIADIVVEDDGLGSNEITLIGADSASFEVIVNSLFLKAGVVLDFEIKSSYSVTIVVDDTSVGNTPDASLDYTLNVTDQVIETPPAPVLIVTEVAPWSSSNSPVGADWFEVTNISEKPVDITGWRVDDNSNAFANSHALIGITTIAPGESVIFIEDAAPPAKANAFRTNWFGANPPAGLQIGSYTGSGIGLGTGGDAVNLFTAAGLLHSRVAFGASPSGPYATFDNTLALNDVTLTALNRTGVNGAFIPANSPQEIGSPGFSAPGVLRITEVAPWASGNSLVGSDWFEVTNLGARAVDITGWKVDDSSESPAAAVPLADITSIKPGESVIFMEATNLPAKLAIFVNTWFGGNAPVALQFGKYSGSGIGLSTGGDAVCLYNTNNVRVAKVEFGISDSIAPYQTFDNSAGLDAATISLLSVVGTNGAFTAATDAKEIGSPGSIANPPFRAASFANWLTSNGFTSGGFGTDSDLDGLADGVEYYFNSNANDPSASSNLPRVEAGASGPALLFTTLLDATGASGMVETSADLIDWSEAFEGIDYAVTSETASGAELSTVLGLAPAVSPAGASVDYLIPNSAETIGGSLGGSRVVNYGLVGVGRFSGAALDVFGETMGAASGLFVTNWRYSSVAGSFTGTFNVLPDRGYNADGIFSNYAARVHHLDFTFTPYYEASAVAQGQIVPVYDNSTLKFTYRDGGKTKFTTGLNPTGTATVLGQTVGVVTAANGPGGTPESLISFDAEAIHLFPDGSGYVSDEYGTYIARFNSSAEITGITQLPESARPHKPVGILNFDSVAPPTNGRRNNQGLEGMSVSPDGTRLLALMQSALVQDTGTGQQGRNNTRLYVYDITGARRENPLLIGEYVVPLPRLDFDGNSSGLDRTAAQSEITAVSNNQFLMLPRDGNGLGTVTGNPIVYKSVQLVDFSSATNILGLADGEGNRVSVAGLLDPSIKAAATLDVVNMLDPTDLAKFGLNTNTAMPDSNTLNEKMEGFALVPDLSTKAENDYFLFVANDNDFQSPDVRMVDASGTLVSYGDGRADTGNGPVTNDAMFYAYRLLIEPGGKRFYRMNVTETPAD